MGCTGKGQTACSKHGGTEGGAKEPGYYLWCSLVSVGSKLPPFCTFLKVVIHFSSIQGSEKATTEELSRTWAGGAEPRSTSLDCPVCTFCFLLCRVQPRVLYSTIVHCSLSYSRWAGLDEEQQFFWKSWKQNLCIALTH